MIVKLKAYMKELNFQLGKSTLFLSAQKSTVKLNIPLTIIIYFLLWIIGLILGRLLTACTLNILDFIMNDNESVRLALRKVIVCGTQITIFFLWVKLIEKRSVSSMGFKRDKPLRAYLVGFSIGLCAITLMTVVLVLSGAVKLKYHQEDVAYILYIFMIALGWIIQSASEEIAIRGWLIPSLGNRIGPGAAISITAVIFGILHLFSAGVSVLSFANLTLSGIFFACYAIMSENIWGVCGLHFAWNLALGNIYGFPVSGFSSNGNTVFMIQKMDLNLLTGGAFGPEGGIVTTMILLMAISILALAWRKRSL